ncbi:MAG: diguanylate cyclase [Candidatus Omnitrophota bacterium]
MDNIQNPQKEPAKDIRFETPTFIDPLTGMYNRYYLFQFLPKELEKARLGNYPLAFLMIDLDGFKKINDTHGHLCGDEVLKQLSGIFKMRIRATDAMVRYAGDEFALLLPAANTEKAKLIAQQLIDDVRNFKFKGPDNQELHNTLSIGYAIFPVDADEQFKLIDLADKALYLSKQKGKNRVSYAKDVTLEEVSSLVAMDAFPCRNFIDREQELNKLKQIYEIVLVSNSLQAACVSGSTGIGKSRMLSELRNHLQDKAAIINCEGTLRHVQDPYHALAQGIGDYLERIKMDSLDVKTILSRVPFEELAELSLLVPQLAGLVEKPQRPGLDNKARFLLFKAFLDFLFELNKLSPVLLVFDDVQFVDKASLELARYLIKQEKNKKMYLVFSLNQEKWVELNKESGFHELWPQIKSGDNFTEIILGNLSKDDLVKMINVIFPNLGDSRDFLEIMYSTTSGNPCFVEEILKSLLESGYIIYQEGHWHLTKEITPQDIPASLEDVVKRRVKNLDEETKEMILQAAVIGEAFDMDLLKKMGNQNEGFLLELVHRAKKMRLVDERDVGKFQFTHKNVQDALYSELGESQRKELHYRIAQTLAEQHKDNLYNVAGELAFHFSKAPQNEDTLKYNRVFSNMTSELFDSYEIMESLQKLAEEIISGEKVEPIVEITDETRGQVFCFIATVLGAIKNFRLYPSHSSMRGISIKEAYEVLRDIFDSKQAERIDISEVEKSLVINAKRIFPKELRRTNIEDLLYLIMDRNIKTISFAKGLQEKELNSLIGYLSLDYQEVMNLGSWKDLLKKEHITHIKIDEIKFTPVGCLGKPGFEDKGKLQDAMLMEFLMGKLDPTAADKSGILKAMRNDPQKLAKAIMEIAENATAQGEAGDKAQVVNKLIGKMHDEVLTGQPLDNYARDLAKVILELEPGLRNKVIRTKLDSSDPGEKEMMENVMVAIPDEVIVDIMAEEYRRNADNLLKVRDFIKEMIPDESRKKILLPKLEAKLTELNASREEASFLVDKLKWEELPVDKKVSTLMASSKEGNFLVEKPKIKEVLQQLNAAHKKEELENSVSQLFSSAKQLSSLDRKQLLGVIADFVKMDFASDAREALGVIARTETLLKRLKTEKDQEALRFLLDIFRDIIRDFVKKFQEAKDILVLENPWAKNYGLFVNRLFSALLVRLRLNEEAERALNETVKNFILEIARDNFLDILIYCFINSSAPEPYDMKEFYQWMGEPLTDGLIHMETERVNRITDLFKKYVFQTKIIKILTDLGEGSIGRLKLLAYEATKKREVNLALIELMGYLKNEALIESISAFLDFKEAFVRRSAILALSEIASEKSREILSSVTREDKDKAIRVFAGEQLRKVQEG